MPHTYTYLTVHVVFSTKLRERSISAQMKPQLCSYISGIVREMGGIVLIANGTEDHMHILTTLPPATSVADAMRVIKTNSSRWVHDKWPESKGFAWQSGYAAFSVSRSAIEDVTRYIETQEEHHRKLRFQDELRALLQRHGIEYDERYLWD